MPRAQRTENVWITNLDADHAKFNYRIGYPGAGSVTTTWKGDASTLRKALQDALDTEPAENGKYVLKLSGCSQTSSDNTFGESEPTNVDGNFSLTRDDLQVLIAQINA